MEIKEFMKSVNRNHLHIYCFSNERKYYAFDYYNLILIHTNKIINEMLEAIKNQADFDLIYSRYSNLEYKQYWNAILKCFQNNIFVSEEKLLNDWSEEDIGLISFPPVHDCNLKCSYCFAKSGKNYINSNREFSSESITELFEFLYTDYFKNKNVLRLDLVSGGEPLLRFETIKEIVRIRDILQEKYHKKMMIWICTNGTLLTEEVCDFLNDNNISIGISLDGDFNEQNNYRRFKDNSSTYQTIINNIKHIKESSKYSSKFKDILALVVITPKTKSIINILKHHKNIGINNVQMKLVRSDIKELSFDNESLINIKKMYSELGNFLFQECKEGNLDYIKMILNDNDYFGKILCRLLLRQIVLYRCQAGKNKIAISADGNIYPCDSFVGIDNFVIGNLHSKTINNNEFKNICVKNSLKCKDCWSRFLCGGDCYQNSYLKNKDILIPDNIFCELQQHIIILSIRLIDELNNSCPQVLKELSRFLQLKNKVIQS